jgi:hypothetical protein
MILELTFAVSQQVEIVGPFTPGNIYYLVVEGCKVPHIQLFKNEHPQNDWEREFEWYLVLDGRFGQFANEKDIIYWATWLANAMAVAAGFTYHGPNSKQMNLFAYKMTGLSSLP